MYCLTQGWPLVGKHGLGGVPDKRDLVVDGPAGHIDEVLGVADGLVQITPGPAHMEYSPIWQFHWRRRWVLHVGHCC